MIGLGSRDAQDGEVGTHRAGEVGTHKLLGKREGWNSIVVLRGVELLQQRGSRNSPFIGECFVGIVSWSNAPWLVS